MTETQDTTSIGATPVPDIDAWLKLHDEHRGRVAALRLHNLGALFAVLAAAGITDVVVPFDGSGDEGLIQSIDARDANGEVDLPAETVTLAHIGFKANEREDRVLDLTTVIENVVYDLLGDTHEGWELARGRSASSPSMSRRARSGSNTTSGTSTSTPTITSSEDGVMGHPYHHALSSARRWGGTADDYLALHQWFDESKSIIAVFRRRALRHHAEGVFMLERFFGPTITISTGRVLPVRPIGEQHVIEDLGFIPSFADWVRAIRPEPWMGRAQPIHKLVDPFAATAEPPVKLVTGESA